MATLAPRVLRSEARVICSGEVQLQLKGSESAVIAKLVDVSTNGFRATHQNADFEPGQVVRFQSIFFAGHARVVWTQERVGQVHSGFQIVRG